MSEDSSDDAEMYKHEIKTAERVLDASMGKATVMISEKLLNVLIELAKKGQP